MKLIIAIIKPEKLDDVREKLIEAGISRLTVHHVTGHGRATSEQGVYRGQVIAPNLTPKVRIEIASNEGFVEPAIDALLKGAQSKTGDLGVGKIFVLPIEECIHIQGLELRSVVILDFRYNKKCNYS